MDAQSDVLHTCVLYTRIFLSGMCTHKHHRAEQLSLVPDTSLSSDTMKSAPNTVHVPIEHLSNAQAHFKDAQNHQLGEQE